MGGDFRVSKNTEHICFVARRFRDAHLQVLSVSLHDSAKGGESIGELSGWMMEAFTQHGRDRRENHTAEGYDPPLTRHHFGFIFDIISFDLNCFRFRVCFCAMLFIEPRTIHAFRALIFRALETAQFVYRKRILIVVIVTRRQLVTARTSISTRGTYRLVGVSRTGSDFQIHLAALADVGLFRHHHRQRLQTLVEPRDLILRRRKCFIILCIGLNTNRLGFACRSFWCPPCWWWRKRVDVIGPINRFVDTKYLADLGLGIQHYRLEFAIELDVCDRITKP